MTDPGIVDSDPVQKTEAVFFGYRLLVFALLLIAIATVISSALAYKGYVDSQKVIHKYFATRPDGTVFMLTPIDQPLLDHAAISSYVARTISKTLSYSYRNYKLVLGEGAGEFTERGFENLIAELEAAGEVALLQDVKRRAVITTTLDTGPVIAGEGPDPNTGVYTWHMQFGGFRLFENTQASKSVRYVFDVTVVRQSEIDKPNGVAIDRIYVRPQASK